MMMSLSSCHYSVRAWDFHDEKRPSTRVSFAPAGAAHDKSCRVAGWGFTYNPMKRRKSRRRRSTLVALEPGLQISCEEYVRIPAQAETPASTHHVAMAAPSLDLHSYPRFLEGVLEMSRLQNFLPSMVLIFIGGWIGNGRSNVQALMRHGQVWIAAGCTILITTASMLINDIFDFRSGTDFINGRKSPLLQGQVHPHHVELVAGCLYGASVIGLCCLEPMILRLLIGGAAVATYLYTPFLKHLTVVKNVVVSGVISSTILVGALAIGGKEQIQNPVVITVALFFFLCVLSREILMDVGDMVGDKAAGVNTLAVRFGGQIGTLTASFCLAAANALLIGLLAVKAQALATIGTLTLLPLHAKMLSLWKQLGASKHTSVVKSIEQVVHQSMVHIGLGVLVLASAA